jgi:hypothetical protein
MVGLINNYPGSGDRERGPQIRIYHFILNLFPAGALLNSNEKLYNLRITYYL